MFNSNYKLQHFKYHQLKKIKIARTHQTYNIINKMHKTRSNRLFLPVNQSSTLFEKPNAKPFKRTKKEIIKLNAPKIEQANSIQLETDDQDKKVFEKQPEEQIVQYEDGIIEYLISQQKHYKIDSNYFKLYKDFNINIRTFIIRYIFKITRKYQCSRKTLALAVYCFDAYLSKRQAKYMDSRHYYVLTAQASLNLAMKHEEIYPPSLEKFTDSEQRKQILLLEADILKTINFKLNIPSLVYFEQYMKEEFKKTPEYAKNRGIVQDTEELINMLCDLSLFDTSLYQYDPYQLAKNIRRIAYKKQSQAPFKEERVILNIKWAIERNPKILQWLKEFKYSSLY